ncbi:hypothetical protein INT46_009515 [Mucor plumbeus]|uniref:Centromere protein M n=1 Tax=Mucor plumbeus TaxID=97098 RepID=A0A8H7RGS9_9FUNG|nr:hypothetical protein INT46_009515 [Mucor plumbeus]
MLKPQYTRRSFNVLLIGPALSGKRTLASQLLRAKDVFYKIYTVESLPKKPLARIDYVLITVDMTQLHSLTILKALTQHMKDRFLTNKMAVVVTKMDKRGKWQFEVEEIQKSVESIFDVHVFYVNFLNELEKKRISDQLSRLIKTNTLQYKNVCTTLLNSVQVYNLDDLEDLNNEEEQTDESDQNQYEDEDDINEPMSDLKIENSD